MLEARLITQLGALHLDAALEAEAGKPLVLVGESGAGKSTILHLLAGLIHPHHGRIVLDGVVLFDADRGIATPAHDRPVGFVFQDYALFPHLSVFENVAFGLRAQHLPAGVILRQTRLVLEQVGIAGLGPRRPHALSGGQRQRVALARALAVEPRLLLLDEPLAALDLKTRLEVRTELRRRLADLTCVTLVVTHSPLEAMVFGERIAVIEHGRVIQTGSRDELLRHPRSGYVAALMGLNLYQGRVSTTDGGLAVVETAGGGRLYVAGAVEGEHIFLAVDPREVTLHVTAPASSAQNVFWGPVTEIIPEPPFGDRVRVVLGTRPPLVAEVTSRAVEALGLREGSVVFASVKATAPRAYV